MNDSHNLDEPEPKRTNLLHEIVKHGIEILWAFFRVLSFQYPEKLLLFGQKINFVENNL